MEYATSNIRYGHGGAGNVIYVGHEVAAYWRPVMQGGTSYFDVGKMRG